MCPDADGNIRGISVPSLPWICPETGLHKQDCSCPTHVKAMIETHAPSKAWSEALDSKRNA